MLYQTATTEETESVYNLVQHTIKTIYPNYYPAEVVDFFCGHHSLDAIRQDVEKGNVSVLIEDDTIVGTGSFQENHITRVYVLPEYQGRGYGTYIMQQIEAEISKRYDSVQLDASLPAAHLYEKLGYQTIRHERYPVANGVILAYEVMEKQFGKEENQNPIYTRRSIRKFQDKPVDRDLLLKIIEAGRAAPSAKNRQPWKFLVYCGEAKQELLSHMKRGIEREEKTPDLPHSAYGLPDARNTLRIMESAPVIIMVLNTNGKSPFATLDEDESFTALNDTLSIGAAVENMLLQAEALDIGTLWIGNTCFAYRELTEYIGTDAQLTGAVAVGYKEEHPFMRPRKSVDDIVEYHE